MRWFAAPDYWFARLAFQRGLAAIYLVAFVAAARQFRPLLGERGLLPIPAYTARVPFRRAPSLFSLHYSDRFFAAAAAVIIVTQLWLVLSGNFAWLNWLTIVLAAAVLDDAAAARVLPLPPAPHLAAPPGWYEGAVLAVTAVVLVLSYRPACNLLSRQQLMNYSFDPLRLVNAYGAFGGITRRRDEVIIEGTSEPRVTPGTRWRESIPRRAARLRAGPALPVPVHDLARTPGDRGLVAAVAGTRVRPARHPADAGSGNLTCDPDRAIRVDGAAVPGGVAQSGRASGS